jgi:hypothetical protein
LCCLQARELADEKQRAQKREREQQEEEQELLEQQELQLKGSAQVSAVTDFAGVLNQTLVSDKEVFM